MPMQRALLFVFFLSVVLLGACGPFRSTEMGMMPDYEEAYYGGEGAMMSESMMGDNRMASLKMEDMDSYQPAVIERQLIYTATLTLHVDDVRETGSEIKTFVENMGGHVTDSSFTRGENAYTGWYTLRVPVEQFDSAMAGLKALAVYVDSEYSNVQDVTEYYMDLEARLANKQAEEVQYLSILDKAVTVEEILSVTSYLSNVRYEIESLQGQLKYYDSQTDYSTITVYLTEDESVSAVTEIWKPLSTLRGAFSDWVVFLQGAVDVVIYLMIFGWPLVLLFWGLRTWFRKNRKSVKK